MDELEVDECIELLKGASLGRIGLLVDGLPVVVPMPFRMEADEVVIRTIRGTKLAAATRNAVVAFEVDELDVRSEHGWSIMVRGIAREIADPRHLATSDGSGPETRFVRISLDLVSGRRVVPEGPRSLTLSRTVFSR